MTKTYLTRLRKSANARSCESRFMFAGLETNGATCAFAAGCTSSSGAFAASAGAIVEDASPATSANATGRSKR